MYFKIEFCIGVIFFFILFNVYIKSQPLINCEVKQVFHISTRSVGICNHVAFATLITIILTMTSHLVHALPSSTIISTHIDLNYLVQYLKPGLNIIFFLTIAALFCHIVSFMSSFLHHPLWWLHLCSSQLCSQLCLLFFHVFLPSIFIKLNWKSPFHLFATMPALLRCKFMEVFDHL